jgi:glycosyltransferase involved in cell wall biosynthesis
MRIVMTLLVRDEADVIGSLLPFHFANGVDFVIATDNGSTDGTTGILEAHERDGRLFLIREAGDLSQEEQVTRMARMAAADFSADWVINSDADEFWFPAEGTLKDLLSAMPRRIGRVRANWWHFPPRPGDGSFADRMTARLCVPQPPRFHHQVKLVHRADPTVVVAGGNHDASGRSCGESQIIRPWTFFISRFARARNSNASSCAGSTSFQASQPATRRSTMPTERGDWASSGRATSSPMRNSREACGRAPTP